MNKYIFYIIIYTFIFSCNDAKEESDYQLFTNVFNDKEIENTQAIIFQGRLDKLKAESFDLYVDRTGEYLFDIKKPMRGIKLLVVNQSTMQIVNKIKDNQAINLKEGNYNLVVTSNNSGELPPQDVVVEMVIINPQNN